MFRISLILLLALSFTGRADAQSSDAAQVLQLINQARINVGLAPLAVNPELAAAAQAHADDMGRNGLNIGHSGSDGSTPETRILSARYRPYSWGPYVGENWAAFRTVGESMNAWMSDEPHRGNILRLQFREIGVGVARSPAGLLILVTDFGAQPNVLPVFMNGAGASVTLTLTDEAAAPEGDGPTVLGRVATVEISGDTDFSKSRKMPFASSIQYASPDGKPISTVYVRLVDSSGRTTVSTATVSEMAVYSVGVPLITASAVPTRKPAPTRRAIPTRTIPPPSSTLMIDSSPDLTPLTGLTMKLEYVPSAAPNATKSVIVRRANTPTGDKRLVSAAFVEDPVATPFSVGLFVASGCLLMLAAAAAFRMRGS